MGQTCQRERAEESALAWLAAAGPDALAWAEAKAGRDGPPEAGAGAADCWAKREKRRDWIFFKYLSIFLS